MSTAPASATTASPSKGLHIGLWVVQGLLAFAFLASGAMKLTQPIASMPPEMTFVQHMPEWTVRFIGLSEALGALGLILPSALRIMPKLTVAAALGLVTVMVLAAGYHLTHDEASHRNRNESPP